MTHQNIPFPFCIARYGVKVLTKVAPLRLMASPGLIALGINLVVLG